MALTDAIGTATGRSQASVGSQVPVGDRRRGLRRDGGVAGEPPSSTRGWHRVLRVGLGGLGAVLLGLAPGAAAAHPVPPKNPTVTATSGLAAVGTGRAGFGGDGGPASRARLDAPEGLAQDSEGDLFIADTGNCRVREVLARGGISLGRTVAPGDITTVAGGPCGRRQDPPPVALAVDRAEDLFVAESSANQIVVVAPRNGPVLGTEVRAHVPTVVAGTGVAGSAGDGGTARSAELDDPSGVAVDGAGNLFVSDTANCRVQEVATSGVVATVAGTGVCGSGGDGGPAMSAQVWDPGALTVGPDGDLFIADQGNRTVRVLALGAGSVLGVPVGAGDLTTVAGEGSYGPYLSDGLSAVGPVAEFNYPTALAADADGDLFVADGDSHVIRVVGNGGTLGARTLTTGSLFTVAGARSTGALARGTAWIGPHLVDPSGLLVEPNGAIVYADRGASVVRSLSSTNGVPGERATS